MNPAAGSLDWRALGVVPWDEAAAAFNRCYENYVVPVHTTGVELAARCRAEDVDPAASYIVRDAAGPVAVGLVARRGAAARLAAFALAPRVRGTGMARPLLARLLAESDARDDATLELEVFEHNVPAVRLYAGQGFMRVDRLFGFRLPPARDVRPELADVATAEFARRLAEDPVAALPWQLQPATLSRLGPPWQVLSDGRASFALADLSRPDAAAVRLVYTAPEARRAGRARALLSAVAGLAGRRPLVAPQLIPETLAPLALALGAEPAEHPQLRMSRRRP